MRRSLSSSSVVSGRIAIRDGEALVLMFIVDRVLPGLTSEALVETQRCLREAAGRVSRRGEAVRYLRCTFIPDQQRCLDLFEAVSAETVRHVNDIAQVPFRWIGEASEDTAPGIAR